MDEYFHELERTVSDPQRASTLWVKGVLEAVDRLSKEFALGIVSGSDKKQIVW